MNAIYITALSYVISPNSVAFRTDYVKVAEDTLSASEMWAKESIVFNDISLMALLAGHHPSESVK